MNKPSPELVAAGQLAHQVHQKIKKMVKPGLNLLEIEAEVKELITQAGMRPAFLGYKGYPAATCLSVNSVVVHGIPYDYELCNGDVISVDLGVENGGWIVDTALTHPVGTVSAEITNLLDVTNQSLENALEQVRAGNTIGDIGHAVQSTVEAAGFYIIRELTGHGVGKQLQMPPTIPNYGRQGKGPVLKEGMVVAIEPITALKPVKVTIDDDNWTIRASTNTVCAHFEHTAYITSGDPIILTGSTPPNIKVAHGQP